jgi:putative resolvase
MEKLLTMKQAKELLGVRTSTIQGWDRDGKIRIVRTIGGRRRIPESEVQRIQGISSNDSLIIGYARVSYASQKDDLDTQVNLLKQKGIETILTDVGSGLNENRKNYQKLLKMIVDRKLSKIVISYQDRLTRFGFSTLESFSSSFGVKIEVLNDNIYKTPQEELVQDLITIIAHFSGKLYGMRSHKSKKIVDAVKEVMKTEDDVQ